MLGPEASLVSLTGIKDKSVEKSMIPEAKLYTCLQIADYGQADSKRQHLSFRLHAFPLMRPISTSIAVSGTSPIASLAKQLL